MAASRSLACPSCAATYPLGERFCPSCGMPLVYANSGEADQPVSEAHERARKIKPQYADGELLKVARANHQAEAEFIQGILLEEGVPSMTRRARGFDVPDMLAAGPRDVLVPASGAGAAREILLAAELITAPADDTRDAARAARVLAGLLAAVALVAIVLWVGTELIG
jgi:pimeloyl-ACP methyl ester carboxylesterase